MTPSLCIVVKGFPRLSETFITRELEALQDSGLRFTLASLRHPQSDAGKVSHRVVAEVNRLPEYLHQEPWRAWCGFRTAQRMPGFAPAWRMFTADWSKDLSRNRVRRFGQACVLASELPAHTRHIHTHFIHTPASVARYAAAIRSISFSISAHAKDIWTTPEWDLSDKMNEAAFVCTCNGAAATRLSGIRPDRPPHLWPHLALPLNGDAQRQLRPDGPVRFLTVARAVPKKGLLLLLDALARLPPAPAWNWTHIGGGEGLAEIQAAARDHPYRDRLSVLGPLAHSQVMDAMRSHDVFVLTAMVGANGDRDGRPNAIVEAMTMGLACIATSVGGIAELLTDGAGMIVDPSPVAIAGALQALLEAPGKRQALAAAGRIRAAALRLEGYTAFAQLEAALRMASGQ